MSEKNLFAVFGPDGSVLAELRGLLRELDEKYLSKVDEGTAQRLITFLKGINIGDYVKNTSGGTFSIQDGNSFAEVDYLTVRKRAQFKELLAEKLSHIGGQLVISAANITISKVETRATTYRCYFDRGDNNEINNAFVMGDLAKCQVFSGGLSKYYWRLVQNIGVDYIDLSIADCDPGSSIPEVGDYVVQFGHKTDVTRQSIQVFSSVGEDAPSYKQYAEINSYSIAGKEKTAFTRTGNRIVGVLELLAGTTGWENIEGLKDAFDEIAVGSENLLLNTGFTGDYESRDLSEEDNLDIDTEMYSDQLRFWDDKNVEIIEDEKSYSGFAAKITDGDLSQLIELEENKKYVLSFLAKGEQIAVTNYINESILLGQTYKKYVFKFTAALGTYIRFSGTGTICDIQLEEGTVESTYKKSYYDNDATTDKFRVLSYLLDAIKNGSTDIIGGLILSSIIQLGNYVDGELQNITAGLSGVYNNETDVAFWAGGTLEQAIKTILNPATKDGSKVAISHGGRIVLLDAFIRGILASADGVNYINMLLPSLNFEDKASGIEFSINKDGNKQIRTRGLTVVSGSGEAESKLPCFRGEYNPVIEDYTDGDTVIYIGQSWRRLKAGPAGITPAANEYWILEAARGADGKSYEFIFKNSATPLNVNDHQPTNPEDRTIDDFIPEGWSDDQHAVTEVLPYEYVCIRQKSNGLWGNFSDLSLWARFSKDGSNGLNARIVKIAGENIFTYPKLSTAPTNALLTLSATLSVGLEGYKWYFKDLQNNWVQIESATSSTLNIYPDGTMAGINWTTIWNGRKELSIKCSDSLGLAYDITAVTKLYDGSDAITVINSNPFASIPATYEGQVPENGYLGTGTLIKVYEGSQPLILTIGAPSAGYFNIIPQVTVGGITVGDISGIGADTATVADHSTMGDDKVVISYQINGRRSNGEEFILVTTQTIVKSKTGASGSDGFDSLSLVTNTENISVDWNDDGVITGDPTIVVKMLKGLTYLPYGLLVTHWSLDIAATGITTPAKQASEDTVTIPLSGMTFDNDTTTTAKLTLTASHGGITITRDIIINRGQKAQIALVGDFDPLASYTGNAKKREIVLYGGTYYITNSDAGTIQGVLPTDATKWTVSQHQKFIATDVLLAAQAFIKLLSGNDIRVLKDGNIVAALTGSGDYPLFLGANDHAEANFKVDALGKMTAKEALVLGKLITALNGNRIEIDPDSQSIKFIDSLDRVLGEYSFFINDSIATAGLKLYHYTAGTETPTFTAEIRPDSINFIKNGGEEVIFGIGKYQFEGATFARIDGLPTEYPYGFNDNLLWLEDGFLRKGIHTDTPVQHLKGKSNTPGVLTGVGAGSGATVSIAGTDAAGAISLISGSLPAAGVLCSVLFNTEYGQSPYICLTAANVNAANVNNRIWVEATTAGFTINTDTDVDPSFEFKFNYHIIQ